MRRCAKCKAVLCRECIRGADKCPRCNAPLKGGAAAQKKVAKTDEPEEEELEEEEEETAPKPPRKRKKRKGDESAKLEDLSRL